MPRPTPIKPTRRGKPIKAATLNELASQSMRRIAGGAGIHVRHQGTQAVISLADPRGGGAGSKPIRLRVKSVQDDYLTCRSWDGTTEGTVDIYVAKPKHIQRTPYDGLSVGGQTYIYSSVNRRTRNNGAIHHEYVTPPYYTDDEIYAIPCNTGVTASGSVAVGLLELSERRWVQVGLMFPVKVTQTGGANGDAINPATYTYTVKSSEGTTLGTSIGLTRPREVGPVTVQSNGWGMAFYASGEYGDDELYLWDAGEIYQVEEC